MANTYFAHAAAAVIAVALASFAPAACAQAQADSAAPTWSQLSAEQKSILAPLEKEWDTLEPAGRKRWLGLAGRYPRLSAQQQQHFQKRIREWAALTPQQRSQVRERYKQLRNLPPEQRKELRQRWHEYQQLPEEKRQQLREQRTPADGKSGTPPR